MLFFLLSLQILVCFILPIRLFHGISRLFIVPALSLLFMQFSLEPLSFTLSGGDLSVVSPYSDQEQAPAVLFNSLIGNLSFLAVVFFGLSKKARDVTIDSWLKRSPAILSVCRILRGPSARSFEYLMTALNIVIALAILYSPSFIHMREQTLMLPRLDYEVFLNSRPDLNVFLWASSLLAGISIIIASLSARFSILILNQVLLSVSAYNFLQWGGERRPLILAVLACLLFLALSCIKSLRHNILSSYKKPFTAVISSVFFVIFFQLLSMRRNIGAGADLGQLIDLINSLGGKVGYHIILLSQASVISSNHSVSLTISDPVLREAYGYLAPLRHLLNTIFPRLLFHFHVFGEPLSSRLHQDLGWRGLDYSILAESIYALGPVVGPLIYYSLIGIVFVALVSKAIKHPSLLSVSGPLTAIYSMVQSLRSDSQNLIKNFLYPFLFLFFIVALLGFLSGASRKFKKSLHL